MSKTPSASAARIRRHWNVLCEEIGERYSGTEGEQRAADYIERQFRQLGLENVHQHRFEFPNWDFSRCAVRAGRGGRLKRVATGRPFCYSVSTPPKGVRGRLVYLQTGTDLDFRQQTRGRIGLLIGSLSLGDPQLKRRLIRAGLRGLLVVDARLPVAWITTAGCAAQWIDGYHIPTASISYFDAHDLVRSSADGPVTIHLTIKARTFPAMSQNVVGEVIGSDRADEIIAVSGHHDCVWGNVGADDNGSGVVFTLELARLFAGRRPRRTIRFISYGVEEKLSLGSYLYMRSLPPRERHRFILSVNADLIASTTGNDSVYVTGTASLEKVARECWMQCRHPATVERLICQYSDHFPLNICGVPSLWLTRPSMLGGGYWHLHSVHDNPENVSVRVISRTINTTRRFIAKVADAPRLPFKRGIDARVMREVRAMAKQEFRHPWSVGQFRYGDG